MPPEPSPAAALAAFLTGTEAREVADRLDAGATLTSALNALGPGRRIEARELLHVASLGTSDRGRLVGVLRAIEGARSTVTAVSPLWTMPGHLAEHGALTGSVQHLVTRARHSLTCSTYNFAKSSALWGALRVAAKRPELAVRVYVDGAVSDQGGWAATPAELATYLFPAVVMRSKEFDDRPTVNHAKFLVIDHRFMLVTSANFSKSAEQNNVEFGILLDNPNLAESVEAQMRNVEAALYEPVTIE